MATTPNKPKSKPISAMSLAGFVSQPKSNDLPSDLLVDDVFAKDQIRTDFDEAYIMELAYKMYKHGQLQNIKVRPSSAQPNKYEIIFGENRWRAKLCMRTPEFEQYLKQMDGLDATVDLTRAERIIAKVGVLTDAQARQEQWSENLDRQQLNKMEIARGLKQEIDEAADKGELLTEAELAKRLGKTQAWVNEHLSLLDMGEIANAAFAEGVTHDVTAVNALARLERTDAGAAKAVVRELKLNPKANAREVIKDKRKEVKEKAMAQPSKASPASPAQPEKLLGGKEAAELLYAKVCTSGKSVASALADLKEEEKTRLMKWLNQHYAAGALIAKSPSPRVVRSILDGFADLRFSAGSDGALAFAAWSLGARQGALSIEAVLNDIIH